jgi:hypothetical protein
MTEATQPRMARGTKLPAAILATALFALLAFAPFASAAADPLGSGTTTVTLNKGFVNSLKKGHGITIQKISPAKVKGNKATFTVTAGSLDPTTGLGTVNLGGGLKFKAGKKSATVKGLVLDTSKKSLTAKVSGKKVKLASVSGFSFTRDGFGVDLKIKKLKLTGAAAAQLNKKFPAATGKGKGKAKGSASASKAAGKPFKGGQTLGSATSETEPATVTVLPTGNLTFNASTTLLGKLKDVKAEVELISPTTAAANVFTSPITGGTISPTGSAGTVQSGGGLKLVQILPTGPTTAITTKITLGAMYVDLSAKTVTVEVVAESDAEVEGKKPLNLGNLGRSSIADITVGGVTADPVTRTVSVNASAVLQPISAEVLEGFVQVYQGYLEAVLQLEGKTKEEAKAIATAAVANDHIKAGEALGTFAFTAQTQ